MIDMAGNYAIYTLIMTGVFAALALVAPAVAAGLTILFVVLVVCPTCYHLVNRGKRP